MTEHRRAQNALTWLADASYTSVYGAAIVRASDAPETFDQTRRELRWTAADAPGFPDITAAHAAETSEETSGKLLALIRENPEVTISELALSIGVTECSIERNLKKLAESLRNNVSVDWAVRESVRAKLRLMVRRILRKYKYPPVKEDAAVALVLEQAAALSAQWREIDPAPLPL